MRYFFLIYAIIAVLFVGIMGFRGQKFHKPPVQVFPDMDNQDKLKAQAPSTFFADRNGGRLPVADTEPRGYSEENGSQAGGVPDYEFGGSDGYYYTGHVGDYFGTGMPEELGLDELGAAALIRRGEERYGIYCSACHGKSGNGVGITSRYGVPGIANFHLGPFKSETYPDGRMFEVITHGKGQMGAYGPNVPIRDRWAIIAYVRTLQAAKENADALAKMAADKESAEKEDVPPVGSTDEVQAVKNPVGVTQDAADSRAVVTPPGNSPPATEVDPLDPATEAVETAPVETPAVAPEEADQ